MAELQPLLPRRIPQSIFPSLDDAPVLPPITSAAMGGGLHALLPVPPTPDVTLDPRMASISSDPLITRKDVLESDLYKRSNPVAPTSTLGKIGHVAAGIGNVLGNIFAPATMALIPGTDLHNERIRNRDQNELEGVSKEQTAADQRKGIEATTAYTTARPAIEQSKIDQKQQAVRDRVSQQAAKQGQKVTWDEDGAPSYEDDPDLLAHAATQAQIELRNAQADLAASKNDPSSPAYAQAERRIAVARANAIAAQTRANAYMGNYQMHAHGTDLQGNPLNGIGMLDGSSVGTSVQGNVSKAIAGQAQFKDVNQGIQHTTGALQALSQEGGSLNDAAMVAALQDPSHSALEWAQGKVNNNLTSNERDAVVAIKAMRERILAMRKASGGTASEGQVHRMLALLPGPQTPDLDTAIRQLKEVQSQADVLGSGVPQIHRAGPAASSAPKAGDVDSGYRFKGGDPSKKENWVKQ